MAPPGGGPPAHPNPTTSRDAYNILLPCLAQRFPQRGDDLAIGRPIIYTWLFQHPLYCWRRGSARVSSARRRLRMWCRFALWRMPWIVIRGSPERATNCWNRLYTLRGWSGLPKQR